MAALRPAGPARADQQVDYDSRIGNVYRLQRCKHPLHRSHGLAVEGQMSLVRLLASATESSNIFFCLPGGHWALTAAEGTTAVRERIVSMLFL